MDKILGVQVDKYTINELLEMVEKGVDSRKKLEIVTLNTELLVASKNNKKLKDLLNTDSIKVPESSGLYIADNFLTTKGSFKLLSLILSGIKAMFGIRQTLPPRIAGVELCYEIASFCAEKGYRLLLLGGAPGVAEKAAERLKKGMPKLKVKAVYGGDSEEEKTKTLTQVKGVEADVIFVAYGVPKQNYWIGENLQNISASVAIGVGGTLDFMAGEVLRAPIWVRKLGMEWLFRLIIQPWRLKRQRSLVTFLKLLLKEA